MLILGQRLGGEWGGEQKLKYSSAQLGPELGNIKYSFHRKGGFNFRIHRYVTREVWLTIWILKS